MGTFITPSPLAFVGRDLRRPECVLCTADGSVFVSNWDGGVTRLDGDGRRTDFLSSGEAAIRPNGIALDRDGSFLLADLGLSGGVWRLQRDGTLEPFLHELQGCRVPPANFVLVDSRGRVWVTVSTRRKPRQVSYRPDVADGFIVVVHRGRARVVADGLGYTNEVQIHPFGDWLYVNETFSRHLRRYRLAADGSLSAPEVVARFGPGTFPDGLAFDQTGAAWITSPVSNRVLRVSPAGAVDVVVEDSDPEHLEWVEAAFVGGSMDRPHLDTIRSQRLRSVSSLAFGGPDRKTAYLGCLLGDRIATFDLEVAGVEPAHWYWSD